MTVSKKLLVIMLFLLGHNNIAQAQDEYIETIFNNPSRSGGYGAISNKFTSINGEFANMVEIYGGWFINQRFMIGGGVAATTNYIPVPELNSTMPGLRMSYEYGQVGLVTEYVLGSNKAIHFVFHLMTGGGFTFQYHRPSWREFGQDDFFDYDHDENWFFVAEPGVQAELNLLRWMRFSPGISYRFTDGSKAEGLSDSDLRGASINLTFKFGRF